MKRILSALIILMGCSKTDHTMFDLVDARSAGIDFVNHIDNADSINILNYIYYYNGAGIGASDFNNDGWIDLFFAGNRSNDALYLNKGGWDFENVTIAAGITKNGWSTGVALVDINADGFLDIYVSRAGGYADSKLRKNILYINQGDGTFTEEAEKYGVADMANTTQSAFLDYDRDGDLDLYVMNHGNERNRVNTPVPLKHTGKEESNDQLYENVEGVFQNVTIKAGILTEGYGLGLTISDFNNDGWPDIFVGNDFVFSDLLYLNNQNGTFTENAQTLLPHQSYNSMGCDAADFNNDGYQDLITLDMLPPDNQRQKTMVGAMNYNRFEQIVNRGYAHQYMRNMLHEGGVEGFNEIGRLAGVASTDWSWAPLLADFDNDGFQDLFISNGYYKDITDKDFMHYSQNITMFTSSGVEDSILLAALAELREVRLSNFIFRNRGGSNFENNTSEWIGEKKTLSNGAVYADFDNDGDLDLVTNNINEPPSLYQNKGANDNHFLKVRLEGNGGNIDGINAKVIAYQGADPLIRYANPYRGFMGSMVDDIHIGLGPLTVDSLIVVWGDEKKSIIRRPPIDTTLVVRQKSASPFAPSVLKVKSKYSVIQGLDFLHQEDPLVDFHIQPLLSARLSCEGPALAVGDLNGDGLDDVFFGGAVGQASVIGFQNKQGFELVDLPNQNIYEDVKADIDDFNGDGFNDLFVSTGGYTHLNDRIYFGPFDNADIPDPIHLPYERISAGALAMEDYDQDGDVDVFVGGRFVPGQYPEYPMSTLLVNDGGTFTTAEGWPRKLGLITDAQWGDLNGDNSIDLIISREWGSLGVLYGNQSALGDLVELGPPGFWTSIELFDLNSDGTLDILAGNYGLNNDFNVSAKTPMEMYSADFDRNGAIDPIITRYYLQESFPVAPRDALLKQIPFMQTRAFKYQTYAVSKISDLLTEDELNAATHYKVTELRSGAFLSGQEGMSFVPFPLRAQYGRVQDMELIEGELTEVLLIGNDYDREVLGGRQDAMGGMVLCFESDSFSVRQTFKLGNARQLEKISFEGENYWLVGQNNDSLKVLNPAYFHQ